MAEKFDVSFNDSGYRGSRHGHTWDSFEKERLKHLYEHGGTLETLCHDLGRSPAGVIPKLAEAGLIFYDVHDLCYYRSPPSSGRVTYQYDWKTSRPRQPTKENIMSNDGIAITHQTLVNGRNLGDFTDAQLFGMIAQQESEIERLSKIQNQPKRLKDELARRQAGIDALVKLLDERDASEQA